MPAGRPKGSVETPETILRQELKRNRDLMDQVRARLEAMIPVENDPETLAKILDTLARASATTVKILDTTNKQEAAEDETLSEEQFNKMLMTGKL